MLTLYTDHIPSDSPPPNLEILLIYYQYNVGNGYLSNSWAVPRTHSVGFFRLFWQLSMKHGQLITVWKHRDWHTG